MGYESLRHLFYAHPEQWETTYQERFRSPFTRHLPLAIQQFGRPQPHPAFYCYTEELAVLQERIHMSFQSCMTVVRQVPHAAIGQFLQHVALKGRAVHDVVVACSRLEHGESVVVARGECDVFGTGRLESLHPLLCIELGGVESVGQMCVFLVVDGLFVHDPLAVANHGVDTPVDEDAEFIVLKILARFQDFLRGLVLCPCAEACQQ